MTLIALTTLLITACGRHPSSAAPTPTATATATASATATATSSPTPTAPTPVAPAGNALFHIPTQAADRGIAVADDGSVWFTEITSNKIGRIGPTGEVSEYSLPDPTRYPRGIVQGPDRGIWFTEEMTQSVGRMSLDGKLSQFPVATMSGATPWDIAAGPDGNVWFTDPSNSSPSEAAVGYITPGGQVTTFVVGGSPNFIASGPDGRMWFGGGFSNGAAIGRVSGLGKVDYLRLDGNVEAMAKGPDGKLWISRSHMPAGTFDLVSINAAGTIQNYALPSNASALHLAVANGSLWFTDLRNSRIGKITVSGTVTEQALPWPDFKPELLAADSRGALWITSATGTSIARFMP